MEFAKSMPGDMYDGSVGHHAHIHRHCGACQQAFQPDERMVSLHHFDGRVDANDAQCVTSHGYAQTGRMAARPWRGCSPLRLPYKSSPKYIYDTVQSWNVPSIGRLPMEILRYIIDYTAFHISWRYAVVLEQAQTLTHTEQVSPLKSRRLSDIRSWSRREAPVIESEYDDEANLVQITLDSSGVKEISRVPASEAQVAEAKISDYELYILEKPSRLKFVTISFMYGLCRLTVPDNVNLVLWNTPRPIKLQTSLNLLPEHTYTRFSALDTRLCFGVTFFFVAGYITAVHAHTRLVPNAIQTFQTFTAGMRKAALWIYIPLPPAESVLGFGLRHLQYDQNNLPTSGQKLSPSVLVDLKRQGLIEVGYKMSGRVQDSVSRTSGRPLLLYNVRDRETNPPCPGATTFRYAGIDVAATYPREGDVEITSHDSTEPLAIPPFKFAYFSSAPLENVIAADVFSDSISSICKGILLRYRNGTERSLGQCRLGFDDVAHVDSPVSIHYSSISYKPPLQKYAIGGHIVQFFDRSTEISEHGKGTADEGEEIRHHDMRGTVEFWSTRADMFLAVVV
ncbi:hypothetical protein CCM_05694 [Cordyceps militaris CM01]|uniref:Uncharacterized protein n=1 Tax=Cordyceps militaris (strain CM01) TaxID=983644 RepID=G3JGY0_CORMM|nr:uncharacterized protein CCM_05694 [Cordyceps militaris CM01]EGX91536.1 hypothetical protein CCM_05694 [Cordyceps militaris CM01]